MSESRERAKLSDAQVREMRYLREFGGLPYSEIGRIFGTTTSNAWYAVRGITHTDIENPQPRVRRKKKSGRPSGRTSHLRVVK